MRLHETAVIHTDDPDNPKLFLTLSGPVIDFATIMPKKIVLRGVAGAVVKGVATIIPKEKYPFKIIDARTWHDDKISFKYEEIQNSNSRGYLLTVENRVVEKGRYVDAVILKTDSPVRSEITLQVYGDIAEAVQKGESPK